MEWLGLVGQVEQDLERTISQGKLPRNGLLPSENSLARSYGVSRTTVREALKRLAARDLVEQRPGRRSRAVPMEVAVTLENLGVVLHGKDPAPPERRRLLEGFLALKRETAVELLAACCEHASARDLDRLEGLCFELADAARWEEKPGRCVALEFELLRWAAHAADRPGQQLLLKSLERSYRAMARQLLPHLDSEATRQWALHVLQALAEKDAPRLRRELPALLQASDARLLEGLAPSGEPTLPSQPSHSADPSPSQQPPADEGAKAGLAQAARPNLSACHTGSSAVPPTGSPSLQAPSAEVGDPLGNEAPGAHTFGGPQEVRGSPPGLQGPLPQLLARSGAGAGPPGHSFFTPPARSRWR